MPRVFAHEPPFSKRMRQPGRLAGGKWTHMRNMWLMNHPHCQQCGKPGEEVHHIVPRAVAPHRTYDYSNLMTLCRACHHALHNNNASR